MCPVAWFAVRAGLGKTIAEMLKAADGRDSASCWSRPTARSPPSPRRKPTRPPRPAGRDPRRRHEGLARRQAAGRDGPRPDGRSADRRLVPPYDFKEDVEAAMRQYLDWEVDLVPQVKRDGDATFSVFKR
jgi:hypothetical protein